MDLGDWSLSNPEILRTIATLQWMQNGDSAMAEKILGFQLGYEFYQRMSGQREVEALRAQTIAAIAKYVKDNPKAKKEELQTELAKHILNFAHKVEQM